MNEWMVGWMGDKQQVHYLIYYASVGLESGYSFIAESASHEVASIVECAFIEGRECHSEILEALLTMHDIAANFGDDVALWGIRRAQIKLAAIYLLHNNREHALRVQQTFIRESKGRLLQLWEQLARITDRQFWEVNDRGTNMNYLSPAEKKQLVVFFAFFGISPSPLIESCTTKGANGVAPQETPRMSISVSVSDIRDSTLSMHKSRDGNQDVYLSTNINNNMHQFENSKRQQVDSPTRNKDTAAAKGATQQSKDAAGKGADSKQQGKAAGESQGKQSSSDDVAPQEGDSGDIPQSKKLKVVTEKAQGQAPPQ
jgi:hypothetical protein